MMSGGPRLLRGRIDYCTREVVKALHLQLLEVGSEGHGSVLRAGGEQGLAVARLLQGGEGVGGVTLVGMRMGTDRCRSK